MKKSLSLLFFTCGLGLYSQPSFHYKFKLNAVTNLAEAKMITDPLRAKFKTYPVFLDVTDYFEFDADVDITDQDLSTLLNSLSYSLTEFNKQTNMVEPVITTKEK